jgi:hypothetical protein
MRFRGVLAAVGGIVTVGIPASASAKYAYCETYAPRQAVRVTTVFEIPESAADSVDPDFETYMEAKLGFNLMPMCHTYNEEARAKKDQAYVLEQISQDMSAILDEGFVTVAAQKYGGGRKSEPAPTAVADSAAQKETSKVVAPAGPSAAELSAERHKAAEERYSAAQAQYEADLAEQQRKVAEFKRLTEEMEHKKAAQQASAQSAMDSFKAEQAAHAEQMSKYQQDMNDYRNKLAQQGSKGSATGGRGQATSAIVDSREAAMAALMRLPVGPLSDVQCGPVTMYSPPKWTCWGFYQSDAKPSEASAQ